MVNSAIQALEANKVKNCFKCWGFSSNMTKYALRFTIASSSDIKRRKVIMGNSCLLIKCNKRGNN